MGSRVRGLSNRMAELVCVCGGGAHECVLLSSLDVPERERERDSPARRCLLRAS